MICGPGAITNAIVLMGDTKGFEQQLLLVFSILVIGLITFIVLLGASRITSFLGATGNKVMMRLMGLIVMVIAVEFFLAGLRPYIESFIRMVHS
jgi:multiple antibiotic resistance protein